MRRSFHRFVLAASLAWIGHDLGDVPLAAQPSVHLGKGVTADDAVRRGLLAGDRIPRTIHDIRARLQHEYGGRLRTHIVANGGHGYPSPSNVAFMCFETYEGPIPGGSVTQGDLMLGFFLEPHGNTLSVGNGFVELIAWDSTKRVYNFWELEGTDWFYRGYSNDIAANVAHLNLGRPDASFISTEPSTGQKNLLRCSGCHTLGAPIMKEIEAPHNDWWRSDRQLPLGTLRPDEQVAKLFAGATDASNLADQIKRAIDRLVIARGVFGQTLPQVMRSLVTTFEINLESDNVPFDTRVHDGNPVEIPSAFFVDPRLIGRAPPVRVDVRAYDVALEQVGSRFPPDSATSVRDAHHAFLVPTPSYADQRVVEGMKTLGTVDAELVSDVLAVDMTTPVFSSARAAILRYFPASASDVAGLRRQLVDALTESPAADDAARSLLTNIVDPTQTAAAHHKAASLFLDTCRKAASNPAAVESWLRHADGQRRAIDEAQTARHPLGAIAEHGFRNVFPSHGRAAQRLRLNPTTCIAEPRP